MWANYEVIQTVKQASWILLISMVVSYGQGEDAGFADLYEAPIVERVLFGDDVMLATERKNYSTNLATYVANLVSVKGASKEALLSARRILALSLHLERRNKQAMVVNFQLRQGVMPKVKIGDYNPRTFSRLLMARAKLLNKAGEGAEKERLLARYFIDVAAHIDPRNEDAVFECESQRIDFGELDWGILTAGPSKSKEAAEIQEPEN
ncbi:MAG: hypothetical protein P8M65_01805 [Roseibacillus sp.]|nr:hypothetical protein [Roseibacillus sp.]